MAKEKRLYSVAQYVEEGVFHVMPYDEPALSNRTACGFQGAWLNRHMGTEDEVTCGACRNSTHFED